MLNQRLGLVLLCLIFVILPFTERSQNYGHTVVILWLSIFTWFSYTVATKHCPRSAQPSPAAQAGRQTTENDFVFHSCWNVHAHWIHDINGTLSVAIVLQMLIPNDSTAIFAAKIEPNLKIPITQCKHERVREKQNVKKRRKKTENSVNWFNISLNRNETFLLEIGRQSKHQTIDVVVVVFSHVEDGGSKNKHNLIESEIQDIFTSNSESTTAATAEGEEVDQTYNNDHLAIGWHFRFCIFLTRYRLRVDGYLCIVHIAYCVCVRVLIWCGLISSFCK